MPSQRSTDPLTRLLLEVNGVQLRWNVEGVDSDGEIDPGRLRVHLFTVDPATLRGGFDAALGREEISRLHGFLQPFAEGLPQAAGSGPRLRIVEQTQALDEVLNLLPALDDQSLSRVISSIGSAEKLDWLAANLDALERRELEASLRYSRRRTALERLRTLVDEDSRPDGNVLALCRDNSELADYRAGKAETVFQRWFEANSWIMGREYVRRHPLRRIGLDSEADLIMETVDGFLDLVELKRPAHSILNFKESAKGAAGFHYGHSELSKAVGQCIRYLKDMEDFKHNLEEQFGARVVTPRVFLVMGRSHLAEMSEREALRRYASSLRQIELLTYDQILDMGRQLIGDGEDEPAA